MPSSAPSVAGTGIWEQTRRYLRNQINQEAFDTWIAPIRLEKLDENKLTLIVPNDFIRKWVLSNYADEIKFCMEELAGAPVELHLRVAEPEEEEAAAPEPVSSPPSASHANEAPIGQMIELCGAELVARPLISNYTFDKFVVGESNRFAYTTFQTAADPSATSYNPLFLYANSGLGKTHLMQALGHELRKYGKHFYVRYVTSENFMNAFIDAVRKKDLTTFRHYFRHVDLLLVDDVQFFSRAERSQIEFFHTFNALYDAGKKIVIASDQPPNELTELEERLRSRFGAGPIVDIQPPDLETRVAILQKKAEAHHVRIDNEVAIYIAERIKNDIRNLEGAVKKFHAHQTSTGEPATISLAQRMLKEFFSGEEPVRINVEKIQLAVGRYFDINLHDLTGHNRSRKFMVPRQLAVYLAREMTQLSYPEIGRKFGGRDHTSIIHAYRKVQRELQGDQSKQNLVKVLAKLIKEEPLSDRLR